MVADSIPLLLPSSIAPARTPSDERFVTITPMARQINSKMNGFVLVKKAELYFKERLHYVAVLWLVIGLISFFATSGNHTLSRLKFDSLADWHVVVVLAIAIIVIGILASLVRQNSYTTQGDNEAWGVYMEHLSDEVSAAATHFACANTVIVVLKRDFSADGLWNLAWGLIFILVAILAFPKSGRKLIAAHIPRPSQPVQNPPP